MIQAGGLPSFSVLDHRYLPSGIRAVPTATAVLTGIAASASADAETLFYCITTDS